MENTKALNIKSVLKGGFLALIVSLFGILIFAGIIKIIGLDSSVIKIINQFIKIISVFVGCLYSLKSSKGLIKGIFVGLIYSLMLYTVFFILGSNQFNKFLTDALFIALVGGISGVLVVNVKSK